jgi:hypothetical protein
MKSLEFTDYKGLDWRALTEASDPLSLLECSNVEITSDRGLQARDQLRLYAVVDTASRGLYVVNDLLRCAMPYPNPGARGCPMPPVGVMYDYLSPADGDYFRGTLDAVEAVAWWDSRPYLCVRVTTPAGDTDYEHHYLPATQTVFQGFVSASVPGSDKVTINNMPYPEVGTGATLWFPQALDVPVAVITSLSVPDYTCAGTGVPAATPPYPVLAMVAQKTKVDLPFEPGPALLVAEGKIWASDRINHTVPYSSTQNGPLDWTAPNDAGFLPTAQNVSGSQPIRGLSVFHDQLTVIYETVVQLWNVDPDPEQHHIVSTVGSAGTLYAKTVANFLGDLVYFGFGGFRSMSAVITTGQAKDSDIGAEIQPRTKLIDLASLSAPPVAVGSAWRSQYLCAIGSTVWVLTLSPQGQVRAWSKWELPWEIGALVEWQAKLYVRRANSGEVYVFDPDWTQEVGFSWSVQFNFSDCDTAHYVKQYKLLELHQRGESTITAYLTPTDLTDKVVIGTIDGPSAGKVALPILAETLSLEFTGTAPWQLDAFILRFDVGRIL